MNVTPINPPSSKQRLCLLAIGLFAISNSVRADYTVIPDDLLPTAVIDARYAQPTQRFAVQFTKGRSALTEIGRNTLSTLMPIMNGSAIKIVGRPDANPAAKGSAIAIPGNRARNIRDYLTRQGIPLNSITIEIDNSPNPQQNGSSYPCDVYVTRIDRSSQSPIGFSASVIANVPQQQPFATTQTYVPSAQQQHAPAPTPMPMPMQAYSAPQQAPQQAASAQPYMPPQQQYAPMQAYSPQQQQPQLQKISATYPAAVTIDANQDQLIQYINAAVQSGRMTPTVAIKMIRAAMLENDKPVSQQPARAPTPAPIAQPIAPIEPPALFVASPALARKKTWTLDKKLTLRENFDAWSKLAGWNPTVWEAANYFEVPATSVLEGEFPEILRQLAGSTRLINVCAKMHEKYIRVTEPNVRCDQ
ncbi:TcpQ domain-containing protein [Janthinobacterium sp. CAN_S7]|uniref:TcpQ domain-containing protein n=1 Tax=Janthinobacterium sp. CAN_S7 TaxID=3071704 RepID=UPI00319E5C91